MEETATARVGLIGVALLAISRLLIGIARLVLIGVHRLLLGIQMASEAGLLARVLSVNASRCLLGRSISALVTGQA